MAIPRHKETTQPAHRRGGVGEEIELTAQQARTYAKDAYIFTYPLVLNYRTMYMQAIKEGAFGKWLHLHFASPADTHIVTPNNDTPYSWAWVDLRAEPWVLTMPRIDEGRYYVSQWNDLWGYVLDNPGSLNDGYGGGSYLLAAPDWEGTTPSGIKRVIRGESTILGSLTRTQPAGGATDMSSVKPIQQGYKLQPLSAFLGKAAPAKAPAVNWPAWTEGDEKIEKFWGYAALMLQFVTPQSADAAEYAKLKALGLEAGQEWDASAFEPAIRDAIKQGIGDAHAEFARIANDPTLDSGTLFGDRKRMGTNYLLRTMGTVMGIFGNVREEAVFIPVPKDAQGDPLDGSKAAYIITFQKGQTPPVKFFWSYTMYKLPQRWLVENPIQRYSISDVTPGVKANADGTLTLYVSHASPGRDKESNWLPAPDGLFWMVLRSYGPDTSIMKHIYKPPEVRRTPR